MSQHNCEVKGWIALALSGFLLMGIETATSANPPKTGATCTKLGLTQNSNGLKFTCIKSGKKLVWGKGVLIPKPAVNPSPSASSSALQADGFPEGMPVPGRTCLVNGDKSEFEKKIMTCVKGYWTLDLISPTPSASASALPTSVPSPSSSATPTVSSAAKAEPSPTSDIDMDGYPKNIPAPGRTCPNEGGHATLYGSKITCIKNTWVLDPGEVISKTPQATASSQPTNSLPSPTATVSVSSQQTDRPSIKAALKAYSDVQTILLNQPQPKFTYNLQISPNADVDLANNARKTLPDSLKFWQSVYSPPSPVTVLLSSWTEKDWMIAADKEAGDTPNGYGGMAAWFDSKPKSGYDTDLGSGMHVGMQVNGAFPKIIIVVSGSDAKNRPGGTTTWPHEYVHNVQAEVMPRQMNSAPCWFLEGMAQYYGLTLSYTESSSFLSKRDAMLKDREYGAYPFDSQKEIAAWSQALKNNEAASCGTVGGYWIGLLAVENMVYLKGTAGIITLMQNFEQSGNFNQAFQSTYKQELTSFYNDMGSYLHDAVDGLLGIAYAPPKTLLPSGTELTSNVLGKVKDAIDASKGVPTSSLIHLKVEPGAMKPEEELWIKNTLQFISYLSPPIAGGDWDLVFPTTMPWFLDNWDMSKETQRYKDMFANNTAEQLVGSVHSYGTSTGGWAASFFVSTSKPWFDQEWQVKFIAQLLKPVGFSSGQYGNSFPEWYSRTFAYPIGAAYSQLTGTGNYASIRNDWISLFKTLKQPVALDDYAVQSAYTGPETQKAPGALAMELLLSKSTLVKATNFFKDTFNANVTWSQQLVTTFGITKADLDAAIASYGS